ncbi:hypothetical protein IMZ48_47120, partial [Candidatus Bathyarchaeota archaeon]|nr:hypothetical protein [Candidatus Bathyarchaeota archaeon]
LFELLPDELQRPLEKVLGGNPFDSQLDENNGQGDRGFGDDIKSKLVSKIRSLMRKVQETLRESILGVVNGGHRKFERESWVFVQSMVEKKVQRYLPKVSISVPDDIGDEGVSVGAPNSGAELGGHHPADDAPQGQHGGEKYDQQGQHGGYNAPHNQHGGEKYDQQGHQPPSQYQNQPPPRPGYSELE